MAGSVFQELFWKRIFIQHYSLLYSCFHLCSVELAWTLTIASSLWRLPYYSWARNFAPSLESHGLFETNIHRCCFWIFAYLRILLSFPHSHKMICMGNNVWMAFFFLQNSVIITLLTFSVLSRNKSITLTRYWSKFTKFVLTKKTQKTKNPLTFMWTNEYGRKVKTFQ